MQVRDRGLRSRGSDLAGSEARPGGGTRGKNISHRRTSFPQTGARNRRRVGAKRTPKFQAQKVIIVQMSNPNRPCPNGPGRRANAVCRTNRSTGNLQRNRARLGQRAPDDDQSSPGRNVNRSGKLQRFLAVLVSTADENRYCQAEPRPLALFFSRGVRTQLPPVQNKDKTPKGAADWGPNLGPSQRRLKTCGTSLPLRELP